MDPFIGSIVLFAGNFAPSGWQFCDGRLLSIAQYSAVYAILGTTYGGDGVSTFALPDFRGRVPTHAGQGPGLSNVALGQVYGSESVTLTTTHLPAHHHPVAAFKTTGSASTPVNDFWAATKTGDDGSPYDTLYEAATDGSMSPAAVSSAGGNQPHNNIMPSLGLNFIICLEGIFPSQN